MKRIAALLICGLCLVAPAATSRAAEAAVEIELLTEPGFPLDGAQTWLQALKSVPTSGLRIRAAEGGERAAVENRGTETAPRYRVIGVLTARNRLRLPGAEFSLQDRAAIAQWFEKLRAEGFSPPGETRAAFGLSSEQLVKFHEQLAAPLDFSTKDQRAGDVARRIVKGTSLTFEVTIEARQAFGRNEPVADELQGVSSGTALAAVLRPLGLVFAPRKGPTREIGLFIADVGQLHEFWPVGWPPQDAPFKVAPTLFERLNVEIKDTPLSETLTVIQGRVKIPFLLDHNSIARLDLKLDDVKVAFPSGRSLYKKILDELLSQAHLTSELRLDEAEHPFLWITSAKR
jgi:hypothetical protein